MDIITIGLFLVCYVLVSLEVLMPGSLWGSIGAAAFITATVLTYQADGFSSAFIVFGVGLTGLAFVLGFSILYFPKFKWAHPFFERASRHGRSVVVLDGEPIIGKQGITTTPLNPSGQVQINDLDYSAYSADGPLPVGTPIIVSGHKISKLIVKKVG